MLKHHKARCGRVDGGQKENTATMALSPRITSNTLSSIVEEIEVHPGHKENTPLSPRLTLTPIMEETEGQQNILVMPLTHMPKEEPIKQHRLFSSPVAGIPMAAGHAGVGN